MSQKLILIADPGIDTSFAIALALHDPTFEVLAIAATPGNVTAEQATRNVHLLINEIDPPRWPRIGAAPAIEFPVSGVALHGPDGFGGLSLPQASLHNPMPAEKLVVELVRQHPGEVTIVLLGPTTVLARAMDRDPELPSLVHRVVCLGGSWHEPGNATAVAEFHFYCDPISARRVLHAGMPLTLIPLDVMRKLVFSPRDLLELPAPESRTCRFLRQIVPYGIRASSNLYGIEGFHLKDVIGIAALSVPGALEVQKYPVDVETRGELTRGMSVIDARPNADLSANVQLAIGVDVVKVREYIDRVLRGAC